MSPAARAVDRAIAVYQHRVSPRKGWRCAHGVLHGGDGCSAAARTLLATRGLLGTALPMAARFLACYQAARMLTRTDVQGVCCCGPIPIPFGWRSPRS